MTMPIWNDVRSCATDILNVLAAFVRANRHEHHGDLVDGVRLALNDAADAVGAEDRLTPDHTPRRGPPRRIADALNAQLRPVVRSAQSQFVLSKALWYVREGLGCARPCAIDVAIEQDLQEYSSSDRFDCYRAHMEYLRQTLARLA